MTTNAPNPDRRTELEELRARLAEAEETLRAIRGGETDALLIAGAAGDEVHLLGSGDRIYRQFIETICEGTATISAGGAILSCSASLAQTLRQPLDRLLGSAMRDHLSPDDHEVFISALAQAGPESHRRKIHLKTGEGSLVPVCLSATWLHSDGAEPVCCLVFTDLEEVISTEQELRRERDRAQSYLDTVEIIIFALDSRGLISLINRKACEVLGWRDNELLGQFWFTKCLHQPEGMENVYPYFLRMVGGELETPKYFENPIVTKSGEQRQIAWHNAVLRDELGRITGLLCSGEDITERKQAEEELRSSRLLYQKTLSSLNEAVLVVDVRTRLVLDCNKTTEAIFGYSREELVGRDTRLLHVDEETFAAFAVEMLAQTAEKGFAAFEFQMRRKNGDVFPTEHFLSPLPEDGGSRFGVVSVIRDITDRKRAEDALRESQQLLEGVINAIPVRVFWKDRNLVYLGCNAAFARDAGFADPKDVIGKDDCQLSWGDQAEKYRGDDRLVIESGAPKYLMEEQQKTPEGKTITLLTSKLPLLNSRGEICGVLGTYYDITERKRAEAERERLSVAIEAAGETVLVTDAKGTIQYVNPVFETVTGYSRAEVIGKKTHILGSGVHDEARYREAMDTFSSGRVWRGRLVNSRKDGSLFTVDTTISPVRDEAGRIVNYVCVERDVTEQLRLAEEKSRLEGQLRQAQKIEAVGRLAGGVAHDFNNLTAIVLGYGEMLLDRLRSDDPARKWAEQIVEAGRRSAALTRQLLAFSRKQTLQPEVLDLNALLRNLEQMLVRLIGEDIGLEFRLAADLGRVTADPGQIEQVVTNLVLNARDAMPRGGKLTLETADVELDGTYALSHAHVVPGKYVMLALTDVGCGMDKATLAHLFEPFFTTKEKGRGTGLGLATAFGIVKQSGGYLYAYSEPDQGTTFKIYLPWTNAAPTVKAAETAGELPRGSGERILLVEDEASLRELCATVLSGLGYRVSAAASGPEALLQVAEQGFAPDLVLSDVIMPGMSGPDLAARLREGRPDIKVLYMSGYPDEAIARHGVLGRGNSFLQKPFSERALAVKVRQALGENTAGPHPVRRVLMIDDDAQFRDLVRHFCAKRGHVFAGVGDAAAAIAVLAGQPCDVLLIDLNIPGTSGGQVLRELRAAGHAAPAIVLTGDVASADMDQLRPLGVVRALEKSSDTGPLLKAIEEPGLAGGEETMRSGGHGG